MANKSTKKNGVINNKENRCVAKKSTAQYLKKHSAGAFSDTCNKLTTISIVNIDERKTSSL